MNELYTKLAQEIQDDFYTYAGVRRCNEDETPVVGGTVRNSYNWDFESDVSAYFTTGEQLDGVCALSITKNMELDDESIEELAEAIKRTQAAAALYAANEGPVILIAGRLASYGTDDGEVVIREPKVLHIF